MKNILKINIINLITLLYLELTYSLLISPNIDKIYSVLIYSILVSLIITLLTTIFKEKTNKIINYIIYIVLCFWYALEAVFKLFLKTYFSLDCFKLTDQAMSFKGETIKVIVENLPIIILFFIPLILIIIFRKKINRNIENKKYLLIYLVLIPLTILIYNVYINSTKDKKSITQYDLYHNIDNVALNIEKLGVLPSTILDIKRTILGFNIEVEPVIKEEEKTEEVEVYKENKIELDLEDKNLNKEIKKYIEETPNTNQNKYTSYFEGKNLILLVAESYSEVAVSEDLTKTLYKLTNNGFKFNNFYVPYYLSTIGGEAQTLTGLYPNYETLPNWKSGENAFPYGLATVFKEKGYNTYAYHNHNGYFQNRNKYLKSLGFDNFKACNMNLDINCNMWPESDVEMIEKTINDYIDNAPFMTYYMTVSGHLDYSRRDNSIVEKNWNKVKDLKYSDKAKSYLATQIELDKALEILINTLEEKKILKDTVIIMLADHYPYGLTLEEINELSTYKRDKNFEINHNSLIIYNSEIDTINIDKVGMPIDVLPTIYNLFGIKYDSRLFSGTDLMSNSEGIVLLDNLSWITNKGKYNSITNEVEGNIDEEYMEYINKTIQNRIIFSKNMLLYNGYKYIKEK